MIIVSLLYVVLWTPAYLHILLLNISTVFKVGDVAFYVVTVVGFVYNCVNPFIYGTNLDPVNRVLLRLIPCTRSTQRADMS